MDNLPQIVLPAYSLVHFPHHKVAGSATASVRANFMCQLDCITGSPDIWLNIILGCVCGGVSR